jgi:dipeptidyl aminopeptidase/acylaminoacyl peptidase
MLGSSGRPTRVLLACGLLLAGTRWPCLAGLEIPASPEDGTLLAQDPLPLTERFSDQVHCYRIAYLSDQLRVVGFLLKPQQAAVPLPLLIYNRGGNREFGKITESVLEYFLAFFAANNYVVLASQYRGSDGGEGRDEFGGADVHDVLSLLRLGEALPYADAQRIVMLGDSRGGMMTYLAIKAGAPLKAAVVIGAPSDLSDSYEERESMAAVLEELIGGSPFEREAQYRERSALYWPEKLTVPLLILHGEEDWRVPPSHSEKLADRLRQLGLPYELVRFSQGDHGLARYRSERNRLILEWFQKHLAQPVAAAPVDMSR